MYENADVGYKTRFRSYDSNSNYSTSLFSGYNSSTPVLGEVDKNLEFFTANKESGNIGRYKRL